MKTYRIQLLVFIFVCIPLFVHSQQTNPVYITYNQKSYPLYPEMLNELPDIPSPCKTENGTEVVIAFTKDKYYTLVPVTVENGEARNYSEGQWGKANQLESDAEDFPTLAKTGVHSETELDRTTGITGKSVAEISEEARPARTSDRDFLPGRASGEGFIAEDEDIISVLKGDNRLVKKLGMIHPELAKPLFNVFNLILQNLYAFRNKIRPVFDIDYMMYNGRKIYLNWEGAKGWQTSIFNDGNPGYYQIYIRRELDPDEKTFLQQNYTHLNSTDMAELIEKLTYIHTGEMVPYYVMRYGFYEGHTGYRTDPIAVAFLFGLKTIQDLKNTFEDELFITISTHFTQEFKVYKHPILNIQFEAPQDWKKQPRPEDRLIYEIADPGKIVHAMLWYTETQQDAPGYLEKMADMKGLTWEGKPIKQQIDGRNAWLLHASGTENNQPVSHLLAVIHYEKTITNADHNALFIVQIRCLEMYYTVKRDQMEEILKSLRFTER